ncbi:response regulator transcription factor [Helicobacter trogontum]|uniref:Response regulator ArsR n=1 Tax=Helicobacter trogontum TaxID=50960 RepID=A0A4U8T926_9HELI|nr:response regulator transcription factor [Helicobacter trogontum]MCI5787038.1 response regulator transcription factor [Helicobacter trogontum]MDY5184673.1 response regulator transcription factor [Helicobacter trogontum]TLD96123.1 response regulator transcription factor [Helicobacter trogontum]
MPKVLIIDNDTNLQKSLHGSLCQAGFETLCITDISVILDKIMQDDIDAVILELLNHEIDGFELCKRIRNHTQIPIIISSSLTHISDKVRAFELGIDDYMTKPYEAIELIARIKALLRRIEPRKRVFGALNIDAKRRTIKLYNENIELTNTEFDILLFLVDNRLQPVSRERIAHTINAIHDDTGLRSIDTHIRNLRNKLGDSAKEPKFIQSVWGIGYKFCL